MSTKIADITVTKQTGTVLTLNTEKKYVSDDIYFNIDVTEGSVMQNAPTVNSSTGVVTATSTVTSGFVSADTKSNTLQLTTQAAQTITPSTSDQTISSGKYLTGDQTISGDANLLAENIKEGITIFGVTGSLAGGNVVISYTTDTHGGTIVTITTEDEPLAVAEEVAF